MNYWQTDLIRLRGVEPEDGDIFWHWNQDSEMARNLEFVWPPISIAQVRQEAAAVWLRFKIARWPLAALLNLEFERWPPPVGFPSPRLRCHLSSR